MWEWLGGRREGADAEDSMTAGNSNSEAVPDDMSSSAPWDSDAKILHGPASLHALLCPPNGSQLAPRIGRPANSDSTGVFENAHGLVRLTLADRLVEWREIRQSWSNDSSPGNAQCSHSLALVPWVGTHGSSLAASLPSSERSAAMLQDHYETLSNDFLQLATALSHSAGLWASKDSDADSELRSMAESRQLAMEGRERIAQAVKDDGLDHANQGAAEDIVHLPDRWNLSAAAASQACSRYAAATLFAKAAEERKNRAASLLAKLRKILQASAPEESPEEAGGGGGEHEPSSEEEEAAQLPLEERVAMAK